MTDLVFDPADENIMIVGVRANTSASGGGIYRSINAQNATPTFTKQLDVNNGRIELAINNIGGAVTVLAATQESNGTLRRSTDGGVTWPTVLTAANGFCGGQCWYDIAVGIHPSNSDIIHLGGAANGGGGAIVMIRSIDAGATFNTVDNGMHADTHAVTIAPSNPDIVYVGSDGGIWKSTDNGATYTSMNNDDFSATQFIGLDLHGSDRHFMIGGTQDNGTPCMGPCGANSDPDTWIRADFGDGGFAVIDQNATDTTNVTMYHTYFNATNFLIGFGRVQNSNDAFDGNWAFFGCGFGTPNGINCADDVEFYAPIARGPGNPNSLYFGTSRLYRSDDLGVTMVDVSGILDGTALGAIGIGPQDDNIRVVGTESGNVFATTTGGAMVNVTEAGFPNTHVGRIVVDPHDSDTVYIGFAGYGAPSGQNVWKTTDLSTGPTWQPAGNGIPDVPINALVVHPNFPDTVYAGTDIGVYWSTDGGANWAPFGTGMPRVAIFGMGIQADFNVLRVATHGRGIWEIDVSLTAAPEIAQLSKTVMTETPLTQGGAVTYTLQLTNTGGLTGTAVVTDVFPAGLSTPICTGFDAAAGFNESGDLSDSVDIPPASQATYVCATSVVTEALDVTMTASVTEVKQGETVTFTINVENTSMADLTDVTLTNTFIPAANCDTNPYDPFNLDAGMMQTFVCSQVMVTETVTSTLMATADMAIDNMAEAMGTQPLTASASTSATVDAMAEATVVYRPQYDLYLPLLMKE